MSENDHPFITLLYALLSIPIALLLAIFSLARKS